MKKIISILLLLFIVSFAFGCLNTSQTRKKVINESELVELPEEINNIYNSECISMTGTGEASSSYIFFTKNISLINYVMFKALSIDYSDYANEEIEFDANNKSIAITLTNNRALSFTFTPDNNIIFRYISNDSVLYQYISINPDCYDELLVFTQFKYNRDAKWYDTPVCKRYIDELLIDKETQDDIVKTYINRFSPVRDYYEDDYLFSGYIQNYYGCYKGMYAARVAGCGLNYLEAEEEETIDGVTFIHPSSNRIYLINETSIMSLKEAYEEGLIDNNDLEKIKNYDNQKTIVIGNPEIELKYFEKMDHSLILSGEVFYTISNSDEYDDFENQYDFKNLNPELDDEFYTDNGLIIFMIPESSSGNLHTLNFTLDGPNYNSYIIDSNYELVRNGVTCDMAYWYVFLTVPNNILYKINTIKIGNRIITRNRNGEEYDIHDDFRDNVVSVIIKHEYSEINKVWNVTDFGDIPISSINDLTHSANPDTCDYSDEFKQILVLNLITPSKQTVIDIVKALKDNEYIEYVGPSFNVYLDWN